MINPRHKKMKGKRKKPFIPLAHPQEGEDGNTR